MDGSGEGSWPARHALTTSVRGEESRSAPHGATATGRDLELAASGSGGKRRTDRELDGVRVAVQGLGAVGGAIVRRLLAAGAQVVAADIDPAAARRAAVLGARIVSPRRLSGAAVDVFIPAAGGGTIDNVFAARCRARVVCGPENCALATPDAEPALLRRGIVYVPDTLASAGGLITGVLYQLENRSDARAAVEGIGPRTTRLLREADRSGLLPSEVVRRTVLRRLSRGR